MTQPSRITPRTRKSPAPDNSAHAAGAEYLIVAPHPDDAELAMGGTIARLIDQGKRVAVVDLTSGEPTPFGSPAIRRRETAAASKLLGLTTRLNLGLPNRTLQATLANRVKLAEVYRTLRPRVVFVPYWHDAHPDHRAAHNLGIDARFHAKLTRTKMKGQPWYPPRLIFYYCTHLRRQEDVTFVIDVSKYIETKFAAVACYQSQFFTNRGPEAGAVLQYVRTLNAFYGQLINRQYAEQFATLETLGLDSFDAII